ncbi:BPSS1780 family membrane protein [Marinicella sediminis]|uniref:BPSS1780 family membrane protein n=1 Tax=Marinicella sediminis TaxID=1792834 RepID=A0ABV7JEB1_9GAMM|nr:BPSS1780 family membrane protein [Marinicella sediminis]
MNQSEQSAHPLSINQQTFNWKNGRQWFDQGVMTFKKIKSYWYLACLLLLVMATLVMQFLPVLVFVVMLVFSPLLTAFIMALCQQSKNQQGVNLAAARADVLKVFNQLVVLGVLTALLSVLFQLIHNQLLLLLGLPVEVTEQMVQTMPGKEAFVRVMVALLTNLPVALAMAFAPVLVLYHAQLPWKAMQWSVAGVLSAWRAFLALTVMFILMTFAVIVLASLMISLLMMVMGTASAMVVNLVIMFAMVTLLGVGLCAQYHAYLDIYIATNEPTDGTEIYTEI